MNIGIILSSGNALKGKADNQEMIAIFYDKCHHIFIYYIV
jgi:hypothetical protein